MGRFILALSIALMACVITAAAIVGGAIGGWGRAPLAPTGEARQFLSAAIGELDKESNGNAAFVLVENGEPMGEHFVSRGAAIDRDTQFQVASLSKWISAWGVMTLVEKGALDLDAPVSRYLTRWSLPESAFDNDQVTVRRLLSHTAGLTDGLGYAGFKPGERVQALEESLTRAADASPGAGGAVRVGREPGAFEYSGGGYTLLQLLVEEASGKPFNDYMAEAVFAPLGMTRSTYILGENPPNVAEFYDVDGTLATHYRFASLAATSLYTSAGDMTRFIQAHFAGPNGEPGRDVLRPETLRLMRKPHASQWGVEIWGLGVMLYVENNQGEFIIGHDGDNEPAINTAVRLDPATGDGIIVLETGNKLLATRLAGEWVFWNTGNLDFLTVTMEAKDTLKTVAIGSGAALLVAFFVAWRMTRRKP